jgi:hypothetical protein
VPTTDFFSAKLAVTSQFIDFRSHLDVNVQARVKVPDNAGGFTWEDDDDPVVLAKARFVPQAGTNRQLSARTTADGVAVTPGVFCVCMPDAVVRVHDHITSVTYSGTDVFEVVYVHEFPGERVVAELWRMQ